MRKNQKDKIGSPQLRRLAWRTFFCACTHHAHTFTSGASDSYMQKKEEATDAVTRTHNARAPRQDTNHATRTHTNTVPYPHHTQRKTSQLCVDRGTRPEPFVATPSEQIFVNRHMDGEMPARHARACAVFRGKPREVSQKSSSRNDLDRNGSGTRRPPRAKPSCRPAGDEMRHDVERRYLPVGRSSPCQTRTKQH